jgi:hypothetical protein
MLFLMRGDQTHRQISPPTQQTSIYHDTHCALHPSVSSQMLSSSMLFPVGPCFNLSSAPYPSHCFCQLTQIEVIASRIPTGVNSRCSCTDKDIAINPKRHLDPCCYALKETPNPLHLRLLDRGLSQTRRFQLVLPHNH